MKHIVPLVLGFSTLVGNSALAQEPSYARHVRPFLAKYCLECHNTKSSKGGLDLETYKAILEGGNKGDVLVPGKPDESRLVTMVEGKAKPVMPPKTAKFHPKGEEIAIVRAWVKAGAKDDSALIKVVIPDIKPRPGAAAPITAVAFHPDGQRLAFAQHDVTKLIYYKQTAREDVFSQKGLVGGLAISPSGNYLAMGFGSPGTSGSIFMQLINLNLPNPQPDKMLTSGLGYDNIHKDTILDVAFSPDGRHLATAGYDTKINLMPSFLEPKHEGKPSVLHEHSDAVYALAFSPDSKLLASCSADRAVKVWDVASGKLLYTLGEATDWLYSVAWSPDGRLASAGVDKSIRVYDAGPAGGRILHSVFAHEAPVQKIVYSKDGKTLYSLGQDRVIKAWDAERMVERKVYDRLPETALALAVRDGEIVVGRYDGVLQVLDEKTGKVVFESGAPKPRAESSRPAGQASAQPLFAAALQATPPPQATKIMPAAGQRNQNLRLIIDGKNLDTVTDVVANVPGTKAKVLSVAPMKVEAEIMFPANTLAGVYEIRLKNSAGTSGPLSFTVDSFSLVVPAEGNDSPGTGQLLKLPASIAGKLDKAGDVDFYRLQVKKGEQLGVHVLTKAAGSKVEPILQLTDARGKVLVESERGFLGYVFPEAGAFALGIRDREFRGGADMHYRLHLGAIPVVTSLFPLGVRRGTDADIHVKGVFLDGPELPAGYIESKRVEANLPGSGERKGQAEASQPAVRVRVKVPADAAIGSKIPVPLSGPLGKPLGDLEIVVGEFPEAATARKSPEATPLLEGTLPVPGTGNGYLQVPGQRDVWKFAAKKGRRLILEVNARRLGSSVDSILEVLDARGQPVPRAVLRCQAKTFVTFRDHDSATSNIRIEAWGELAVNDLIFLNGELIKILSLPTHPDADCIFFNAAGQRTGFLDTTPTHHSQNEPMYKITLHPPGSTFPANGYPIFTLFYRNDDGGPGYGRDSRLIFDPPADGDYQVRVSDSRGQAGDNFGYRVTVRPPRPSFAVRFSPTNPVVSKGGALPISATAERIDGYDGPIALQFADLPAGFSAPATYIEAGQSTTAFALHADASAKPPEKPQPLKLIASAVIEGQKQVKEVVGEAPKLIEPGEIVARTDEAEVTVRPGGEVKLTVHIERRQGFQGRIPLDVRGLPHGVRVLDLGLNGILVNENETRRTIVIHAEPWVEASAHPFVVLAKREGKNTEHAAKSVVLKVSR